MKKTIIFIVLISFSILFGEEGKKWEISFSFEDNPITFKIYNQNETKGFHFTVPEFYLRLEEKNNQKEATHSLSVSGFYNFPDFGKVGLKIGSYNSINGEMVSAKTSTTRVMAGYSGTIISLMAGMDFNEISDKKVSQTPVIEARFIWPLLVYEEVLFIAQPQKNNSFLMNRLGIGLVFLEAGWEYQMINYENSSKYRNAIFVGLFHIITFSIGEDYFYSGLRFII